MSTLTPRAVLTPKQSKERTALEADKETLFASAGAVDWDKLFAKVPVLQKVGKALASQQHRVLEAPV